jgi:ABC-type Mn2+/Zn2+ transport system ATPase subunit
VSSAPLAGTLSVLGGRPGRRGSTSYVMQSPAFPTGTPITVREAVAMGLYPELGWFRRPRATDRPVRVQEAMERLGVTEPEPAGTWTSSPVRPAAAGLRGPGHRAQRHEVLLLDEPLTGLDLVSMRTIDAIIHTERDHGHGWCSPPTT